MAAKHSIHQAENRSEHDAFGHWLSGFIDGEGCFNLVFSKRPYVSVRHTFIIGLRADDRPILEDIRQFLGCGRVKEKRSPSLLRKPEWNPQVTFEITKAAEIVKLFLPHFDRYPLRAKKAKDLIIWQRAVHIAYQCTLTPRRYRSGGGGMVPVWTQHEIKEFTYLQATLKAGRKFNGKIGAPSINGAKNDKTLFDEATEEG